MNASASFKSNMWRERLICSTTLEPHKSLELIKVLITMIMNCHALLEKITAISKFWNSVFFLSEILEPKARELKELKNINNSRDGRRRIRTIYTAADCAIIGTDVDRTDMRSNTVLQVLKQYSVHVLLLA